MKKTLRRIAETAGAWAARSYITGTHLEDALHANDSLQAHGYKSTICFWDGAGDTAENIIANYDATIAGIGDSSTESYVSVKPWPLQYSLECFHRLAQDAKSRAVKMHFDSASTSDQDKTLRLIRELLPVSGTLGYTLPGRWNRSVADADLAIEHGLEVRVVKGQWANPLEHTDPAEGFLRVIERLSGHAKHVSVATHDPKVAKAALSTLMAQGTACELELLYGLPVRAVLPMAKEMGVPVRIYLPYGYAWLPYVLERVRKEPRVAFWLMRDVIGSVRQRSSGTEGTSRLPVWSHTVAIKHIATNGR